MKLIKSSFEILDTNGYNLDGIFKDIERAARVCYKSEDKITKHSAKKMVDSLIKRGHTSCLEHGTVYLKIPYIRNDASYRIDCYKYNPYSKAKYIYEKDNLYLYITTNMRVLVENGWLEDLKYLCDPTEYHEKRYTVRFFTDIGVTREANRHRVNSMAEQSTRYCNYSKEKFGGELSISLPTDLTEEEIHDSKEKFNSSESDCFHEMCKLIGERNEDIFDIVSTWLFANLSCEWSYLRLLELGWKPQQARRVLPLDTHSELVHTAFVSDWEHLFQLRSRIAASGKPHSDMQALIDPLMDEFINRNYI